MEYDYDFSIALDFIPSSSPRRVLTAASEFLEALESLDSLLVKSVAPSLKCSYRLQSVQSGSLLTYIKAVLETVDDEELKKGNTNVLIGAFMLKAKYACLSYLSRHNGIGKRNDLMELANSVHMIALQSGISQMQAYSKPPLYELGKEARKISDSLQLLEEGESVAFQIDEQQTALTRHMVVTPADLELLLVEREISTPTKMILKVRKPDFLGNSRWEFRYNGQSVFIPVNDAEWLAKFQSGKQDFRPGVSLVVECTHTVSYGYDGEVVEESRVIEKVLDIIPKQEQFTLL